MKPSLLTPSDVAELLQLDVRTVRRMRLRGELPEGIQVGKSVRWRPEEIQRWLKERGS